MDSNINMDILDSQYTYQLSRELADLKLKEYAEKINLLVNMIEKLPETFGTTDYELVQ